MHVEEVGGFGSSPKYPRPPYWIHLLLFTVGIHWWCLTSAEIAADVCAPTLTVQIRCPPAVRPRTTYCKPPSYRAHHLCRRRLQCWVNKAEPLVSAAKLAARDRTLNEWFKVSSEQLSQLINLLMAVHVWKEAGVGGCGCSSVASPFQVETYANIAQSRTTGALFRSDPGIQRVLKD